MLAGFLVARGDASYQVELVLVSIYVNVLAVAGCVKSSEVLVSLVSCTINTESVLNLRTTKTDRVSRCLLHVCHVRTTYDERCSVQCIRVALGDDCHSSGMLRQQYDTSAVVSERAHGFYTVPYSYEFFQQGDVLRIVSTRQNKECLTERIDN